MNHFIPFSKDELRILRLSCVSRQCFLIDEYRKTENLDEKKYYLHEYNLALEMEQKIRETLLSIIE